MPGGPPPLPPSERLQVGECTVDLPTREVHAPGRRSPRRITPKALGVLLVLVANAGRVVSRDTLFAEVWPDTLPTDDVLTQAVTQLRKAFGESAGNPRYIETIAKGGYRLLAPVQWLEESAPPESVARPVAQGRSALATAGDAAPAAAAPALAASPHRASPRWSLREHAVVGMLALVAVLGLLVLLLTRGEERAPPVADRPAPMPPVERPYRLITSNPGFEISPTLSPDASQVAYAASQADRPGTAILVQTTDLARPRVLTRPAPDQSDRSPAWSPDGREIAFIRVGLTEGCAIIVVPASGGAERQVGQCARHDLLGFSWVPDGSGLLFGSMTTAAGRVGIRILDLASGSWRALEYPRADAELDYLPRYSPDGRWIVFVRNPQLGDFWRIPADGGEARQLSRQAAEVRGWDWLPGGDALLFGRRVGSQTRLYRLDLASGAVVDFGVGDAQSPAVAGRAGKLAFVRRQPQFLLHRFDRDEALGGDEQLPAAETLFESSGRDSLPSIAPDGTQLVFVSDRSGRDTLWWSRLDDPAALRPIEGFVPDSGRLPEWSWDSRRVMLVGRDARGRAGVYEVGAASGQATRLPVPAERPVQAMYLPDPDRVLVGVQAADGAIRLVLYDRRVQPWRELASLPDVSQAKVDPARKRILFSRLSADGLWEIGDDLAPRRLRQVDADYPTRWRYRSWDVARDGSIAYVDQGVDCLVRLRLIGDGPEGGPRCLSPDRLASSNGFSVSTRANAIFLSMAGRDGADIGFMRLDDAAASD